MGTGPKYSWWHFPDIFNFFFFLIWWPVVTILFICPGAKPKRFEEGMSLSGRSLSLFSACCMRKMWLGHSVHRKTPLPPCECKSRAPQIPFSINLWERIWAKRVWVCCCSRGEPSLPVPALVPYGRIRAVCAPAAASSISKPSPSICWIKAVSILQRLNLMHTVLFSFFFFFLNCEVLYNQGMQLVSGEMWPSLGWNMATF